MPEPREITKAEMREITWSEDGTVNDPRKKVVKVQFNPQSLRVSFSNQTSGGDQAGGSSIQYAGRSSTRLNVELWFDSTVPVEGDRFATNGDVRELTKEIVYFITPKEDGERTPPGVRFAWGSFLFDGVVESVTENLEYFSENGVPLRANVTLQLFRQEIQFRIDSRQANSGPGTSPQVPALSGDTCQGLALQAGFGADWKPLALANGIENPRMLQAGALLNVSAGASLKVGGGVSGGVSGGISSGSSLTGGSSFNSSASAQATVDLRASASLNAAAGVGVGTRR